MQSGWPWIGLGMVLGLTGLPVWGADPDPEAVRRLMEQYKREAEAKKPPPVSKPATKPAPKPAPKKPTVNYDREAWKSAEKCGTVACFEAYLADYPKGRYARMARARLKAASAPRTPVAPAVVAPAPSPRQSSLEPEMVRIPGGCFEMGSPDWEEERSSDERQHRVCVDTFEIGKYEITQGQWQAVMGDNPSFFKLGDDYPVENVSWNDVQSYLQKLNARTDRTYRLPTEAEWEYACRGGVAGQRYCGGDDPARLAWYGDNSGVQTHPVGRKAANGFGLYDMSGNVWEWTCSLYDGSYSGAENNCSNNNTGFLRSLRGGSWNDGPARVRSANRDGNTPTYRNDYHGVPPRQIVISL